ncbi:MAG: LamG-like jellyroll fold domain-containing protein [Minisyncoccia bacterium]
MKKSFTVLEILIVLAIISSLVAILIYYIKPTEFFTRARDTKRIMDLNSLDYILSSLVYEDPSINLGATNTVYLSLPMDIATTNCKAQYTDLPDLPTGWSYYCVSRASTTNIDGSGWVPVNFSSYKIINLQKLPIDPINKPPYYYTYVAGGSYKLSAKLEKNYDASIKDGGNDPLLYEVGSDKNLNTFQSGLVLYIPFDNIDSANGKALDNSGFNNNGTIYSSTTICTNYPTPPSGCPQLVDGKVGKALSFDGVDDYVEVPDSPSLKLVSAGTIAVWVYQRTAAEFKGGICKAVTTAWIYTDYGIVQRNAQGWYGVIANGISSNSIGVALSSLNTWYFLVFTWDGTYLRLYVNGKLAKSGTQTITPRISNNPFRIGPWGTITNTIDGLIDEVRVYNRALSAEEIKVLYEATK